MSAIEVTAVGVSDVLELERSEVAELFGQLGIGHCAGEPLITQHAPLEIRRPHGARGFRSRRPPRGVVLTLRGPPEAIVVSHRGQAVSDHDGGLADHGFVEGQLEACSVSASRLDVVVVQDAMGAETLYRTFRRYARIRSTVLDAAPWDPGPTLPRYLAATFGGFLAPCAPGVNKSFSPAGQLHRFPVAIGSRRTVAWSGVSCEDS